MKRINIKDSVRNNVTSIDKFNTQIIETVGLVIECSERANTCTVNYKNSEGKAEIKTNVPIRLADPDNLGWYPQKEDYVIVKLDGNTPVITGDAGQLMFKNKLREKTRFENNIFATLTESIGGFLI